MWRELIIGVAAPALISAAATLPAMNAWRARSAGTAARLGWAGATAIGGGYLAAHALLCGLPAWPPAERWQWVFHSGVAATIIVTINCALPVSRGLTIGLGLLLGAAVAWLLHPPPIIENPWAWRFAAGAATLVLTISLESFAARRPGPAIPIILTATAAAASVIILQSGFAKLAQLVGALAAAMGSIAALACWTRQLSVARGVMAVFAPLLVTMLMIGWLYMRAGASVSIPAASFILVALAPAATWAGELSPWRTRTWVGTLMTLALPGALLAIALVMAKPPAAMPP